MDVEDDRQETDDAALAERAKAGDRAAFTRLMQRHAPRLAAYLGARIRRIDLVERLVEEAVAVAWQHRHKIRERSVDVWLRRLGANLAMRWHKAHPDEPLVGDFPVDRCASLQEAAAMVRLEQRLGALGERDRLALEHRFRGGLEGEELATALHATPQEAADQVEQALSALLEQDAEAP